MWFKNKFPHLETFVAKTNERNETTFFIYILEKWRDEFLKKELVPEVNNKKKICTLIQQIRTYTQKNLSIVRLNYLIECMLFPTSF